MKRQNSRRAKLHGLSRVAQGRTAQDRRQLAASGDQSATSWDRPTYDLGRFTQIEPMPDRAEADTDRGAGT